MVVEFGELNGVVVEHSVALAFRVVAIFEWGESIGDRTHLIAFRVQKN